MCDEQEDPKPIVGTDGKPVKLETARLAVQDPEKVVRLLQDRPYVGDLIVNTGGEVHMVGHVEKIPEWTNLDEPHPDKSPKELGKTGWRVFVYDEPERVIKAGGETALVPTLLKLYDDLDAVKYDLPSDQWPPIDAFVFRAGYSIHVPEGWMLTIERDSIVESPSVRGA
jgi:hypothetical protein